MSTVDVRDMFPKAGSTNGTQPNGRREDREPEWLWLNFGYEMEITNGDGEVETHFIPLPYGLPVGTMKPRKVNGAGESESSQIFQEKMQAGNDFLLQLIAVAKAKLKPGESCILMRDPSTGLCAQLQRVKEPTAQTAQPGNRFRMNFNIAV